MLNRRVFSIILILLATGVLIVERSIGGTLLGGFLLVLMLFLWAIPENAFTPDPKHPGRTIKRVVRPFLGIGLGLFASVVVAVLLPPQLISWLIIAVCIAMIAWFFIRRR